MVFEHQVQVLISGSVDTTDALRRMLEVWKLPHLLGKGVRPLALTPLLCTCCQVLLSFRCRRCRSGLSDIAVQSSFCLKVYVTLSRLGSFSLFFIRKVKISPTEQGRACAAGDKVESRQP